jgi:hypothetical protein
MAVHYLTIDMDKVCPRCGKKGVPCLKCGLDKLTGGKPMITEGVLQQVAGDVEKLLLEKQEQIAWAYKKIPDGLKVSIGILLEPKSNGVSVDYTVSFPLEPPNDPVLKEKVEMHRIINENQPELEGVK